MSIHSFPSPVEQRINERVPFVSLALATRGDRSEVLQVRDISTSGAFLFAKLRKLEGLEEGMELDIELVDHREPICFTAVIARQGEPDAEGAEQFAMGIGLQISEIDDSNRELLEEVIGRGDRPSLQLVH